MNTIKNKYLFIIILIIFTLLLWGCNHSEHSSHEEHESHESDDHIEHAGEEHHHEEENHSQDEYKEEKHEGHGHEDDNHDDQTHVKLTKAAQDFAGIKLSEVTKATLSNKIELSGEIGLNEDKTVSITPRYAGIVKAFGKKLGEYVAKGEILATIESNESFTKYNIVSPISGYVIKKNISIGEFKGEEERIYVVSDLSNLWVKCEVYPSMANQLMVGQEVEIEAVGTKLKTLGEINYIAPIFNNETRSAITRMEISSDNLKWRPGMFVFAQIEQKTDEPVTVVRKDAVQVLNEKDVVFIREEHNIFEPVEITTGHSDDNYVEIISGLHPGDEYVAEGAFELKAKIVTSTLGDHAGHGH